MKNCIEQIHESPAPLNGYRAFRGVCLAQAECIGKSRVTPQSVLLGYDFSDGFIQ